ncbi:hypothetical protein [Bernardetia sp.]|uniref:hypothetical protein n=1 Tax=Bernardetia sp. TaxID=1937974 RepID=UPI0025B88946|nr:hypothetical protein [Bernardetia sp.]
MKKEYLTLEDRKILRGRSKKMFSTYLSVLVLGSICWWIYQEYFADEKYTFESVLLLSFVGIVKLFGWIYYSLEEWQHYKWVLIGKIKEKDKYADTESKYWFFKINDETVIISEEDYKKYKVGQRIKVEQTALSKRIIRITAL